MALSTRFGQICKTALAGLVLALLAACSPLKLIDSLTPDGSYTRTEGIAYGSDSRQTLDVYKPVQPLVDTPVVVFFYGGSWNVGSRSDYRFVGEALASRGIVTVIADYRLYPQVRYPAFLYDGAKAVAWTRQHAREYGADPQRLFLMGHSAGAYNAAMLALDPSLLAAVGLAPADIRGWIGLAGPYDFLPISDGEVRPVFFYPDSPPSSQPINHVQAGAPPALLIAPSDDDVVNPRRNTDGLAQKLREAGVPVQERFYSRINHSTLVASLSWPLRWRAPTLDDVMAFIRSTPPRAQ